MRGDGVAMDRLGVLADIEKSAEAGTVGRDELRIFLLLLAGYDYGRKRGELRRSDVAAALGGEFLRSRFDLACRGLSSLGFLEILSPFPEGGGDEGRVMIYLIPFLTKVQK